MLHSTNFRIDQKVLRVVRNLYKSSDNCSLYELNPLYFHNQTHEISLLNLKTNPIISNLQIFRIYYCTLDLNLKDLLRICIQLRNIHIENCHGNDITQNELVLNQKITSRFRNSNLKRLTLIKNMNLGTFMILQIIDSYAPEFTILYISRTHL